MGLLFWFRDPTIEDTFFFKYYVSSDKPSFSNTLNSGQTYTTLLNMCRILTKSNCKIEINQNEFNLSALY